MKIFPQAISYRNLKSSLLGSVPSFLNSATFTSTTATIWTVPNGVNLIWVKMWGGGGAGKYAYAGGGGGFISIYLKVKPGYMFYVRAAPGGFNTYFPENCTPGAGRITGEIDFSTGGSASSIQGIYDAKFVWDDNPSSFPTVNSNGYITYCIAGGGGGGNGANGGGGGGPIGLGGGGAFPGSGASGSIGGAGGGNAGYGGNAYNGLVVGGGSSEEDILDCSPDYPELPIILGSFGGSGYAGGGGSGPSNGGGGGSSFSSKGWIISNISGSTGGSAANSSDADYSSGKGAGGYNSSGGDGYVVIRY